MSNYLDDALDEERRLLEQATSMAQIQHLMNRAVRSNARIRELEEAIGAPEPAEGPADQESTVPASESAPHAPTPPAPDGE